MVAKINTKRYLLLAAMCRNTITVEEISTVVVNLGRKKGTNITFLEESDFSGTVMCFKKLLGCNFCIDTIIYEVIFSDISLFASAERHNLFSNNFWSKICEWTAWCFMCLNCTWNKILDSKVQRKCEKVVQKLKKLFYFSSHYKFAIYTMLYFYYNVKFIMF